MSTVQFCFWFILRLEVSCAYGSPPPSRKTNGRGRQRGLSTIPGCGAHHSRVVNLKSRRDSVFGQTPVFVQSVMRTTLYPAYFGSMSSHRSSESFVLPQAYRITLPGIGKESDCYSSSKNKWLQEKEQNKLLREAQRLRDKLSNDHKNAVAMKDEVALQDGDISSGVHHTYPVEDVSGSPSSSKRSKQVTSSRRTSETKLSHNGSLAPKPPCDTDVPLPEREVLQPRHQAEVEMGEDGSSYVTVHHPKSTGDACPEQQQLNDINEQLNKEKLKKLYDKVLIVDTISAARRVVQLLTTKHKGLIHACDTEVC